MNDDFSGLFLGFLVGAVITALYASFLRDIGREDCEVTLTRTEQCVQVWLPKHRAEQLAKEPEKTK